MTTIEFVEASAECLKTMCDTLEGGRSGVEVSTHPEVQMACLAFRYEGDEVAALSVDSHGAVTDRAGNMVDVVAPARNYPEQFAVEVFTAGMRTIATNIARIAATNRCGVT